MVGWILKLAAALIAARVTVTVIRAARGKLPWSRVPLALLLGIEACAYLLNLGGGLIARAAIGAFEAVVVIYAVIAVRRGGAASAGAPLEVRLEAVMARVLPPTVARVVAMECAILGAVLTRKGGAAPIEGGTSFGYTSESFLRVLVLAYPVLLVGDEAVVMAMLPPGWIGLHVVIAILSAYGWVWLIGVHRTMVQRPHVIAGDVVRVHKGILGSAVIARSDVVAARVVEPGEKPAGARLDVAGVERVLVTLRRPVAWRGFFGAGESDRVVVSAEDARAFCGALTAR